VTKANQQLFLTAIGGVLAQIEQEAYGRGLADGKRRAAEQRSAAADEKDAVITNLRAQRRGLRDAMLVIISHVCPSGNDRGNSAVQAIAVAALQASSVDPEVSSAEAQS